MFLATWRQYRAGTALALSPSRVAAPDIVARRKRHARFQSFELDSGAGAGAQQAVGGFAQGRPALLRVFYQRRVECREEGGDVAVHPRAQLVVDIGRGAFLAMGDIAVGARRRTGIGGRSCL